jgi:hypothetical protein
MATHVPACVIITAVTHRFYSVTNPDELIPARQSDKPSAEPTMSTFGQFLRVTTYGERYVSFSSWNIAPAANFHSHCPSVGCIVDNFPPGVPISEEILIALLCDRAFSAWPSDSVVSGAEQMRASFQDNYGILLK